MSKSLSASLPEQIIKKVIGCSKKNEKHTLAGLAGGWMLGEMAGGGEGTMGSDGEDGLSVEGGRL